jgi:hypothetical protein
MKSLKNFCSSSFTLLGREDILRVKMFLKRGGSEKKTMLKSVMGFGFWCEMQIAQGCKVCPFGVLINYYDMRSKGHIWLGFHVFRFNNC